ncbi:MAG: hypothetical protein JXX14_17995, partial [Deltaproteobacteria bacterium]|nr:hypothetical protein [Deltaproteobacteria bacterium]
TCVDDGMTNPTNKCEICDVDKNADAWSPNNGAECEDGDPCTTGETCNGLVCSGGEDVCVDTDTTTADPDSDSATADAN